MKLSGEDDESSEIGQAYKKQNEKKEHVNPTDRFEVFNANRQHEGGISQNGKNILDKLLPLIQHYKENNVKEFVKGYHKKSLSTSQPKLNDFAFHFGGKGADFSKKIVKKTGKHEESLNKKLNACTLDETNYNEEGRVDDAKAVITIDYPMNIPHNTPITKPHSHGSMHQHPQSSSGGASHKLTSHTKKKDSEGYYSHKHEHDYSSHASNSQKNHPEDPNSAQYNSSHFQLKHYNHVPNQTKSSQKNTSNYLHQRTTSSSHTDRQRGLLGSAGQRAKSNPKGKQISHKRTKSDISYSNKDPNMRVVMRDNYISSYLGKKEDSEEKDKSTPRINAFSRKISGATFENEESKLDQAIKNKLKKSILNMNPHSEKPKSSESNYSTAKHHTCSKKTYTTPRSPHQSPTRSTKASCSDSKRLMQHYEKNLKQAQAKSDSKTHSSYSKLCTDLKRISNIKTNATHTTHTTNTTTQPHPSPNEKHHHHYHHDSAAKSNSKSYIKSSTIDNTLKHYSNTNTAGTRVHSKTHHTHSASSSHHVHAAAAATNANSNVASNAASSLVPSSFHSHYNTNSSNASNTGAAASSGAAHAQTHYKTSASSIQNTLRERERDQLLQNNYVNPSHVYNQNKLKANFHENVMPNQNIVQTQNPPPNSYNNLNPATNAPLYSKVLHKRSISDGNAALLAKKKCRNVGVKKIDKQKEKVAHDKNKKNNSKIIAQKTAELVEMMKKMSPISEKIQEITNLLNQNKKDCNLDSTALLNLLNLQNFQGLKIDNSKKTASKNAVQQDVTEKKKEGVHHKHSKSMHVSEFEEINGSNKSLVKESGKKKGIAWKAPSKAVLHERSQSTQIRGGKGTQPKHGGESAHPSRPVYTGQYSHAPSHSHHHSSGYAKNKSNERTDHPHTNLYTESDEDDHYAEGQIHQLNDLNQITASHKVNHVQNTNSAGNYSVKTKTSSHTPAVQQPASSVLNTSHTSNTSLTPGYSANTMNIDPNKVKKIKKLIYDDKHSFSKLNPNPGYHPPEKNSHSFVMEDNYEDIAENELEESNNLNINNIKDFNNINPYQKQSNYVFANKYGNQLHDSEQIKSQVQANSQEPRAKSSNIENPLSMFKQLTATDVNIESLMNPQYVPKGNKDIIYNKENKEFIHALYAKSSQKQATKEKDRYERSEEMLKMKKMSDKIESNLSKLKIMEKKFNLGEQAVKEGGSHNMKMKGHTLDERKTENVNNSEKKKLEEELALLNAENNPSYINKNKLHEFLAKQYRKPEEKNTPNQYSKNHNNQSNPKSNHKRELSSNFQQKPKKTISGDNGSILKKMAISVPHSKVVSSTQSPENKKAKEKKGNININMNFNNNKNKYVLIIEKEEEKQQLQGRHSKDSKERPNCSSSKASNSEDLGESEMHLNKNKHKLKMMKGSHDTSGSKHHPQQHHYDDYQYKQHQHQHQQQALRQEGPTNSPNLKGKRLIDDLEQEDLLRREKARNLQKQIEHAKDSHHKQREREQEREKEKEKEKEKSGGSASSSEKKRGIHPLSSGVGNSHEKKSAFDKESKERKPKSKLRMLKSKEQELPTSAPSPQKNNKEEVTDREAKTKLKYAKDVQKLSKHISACFEKENDAPQTGTEFYRIGKLLGKGAFGKVNLGVHKLSGKLVAIKSINKEFLTDETSKKKVMQEYAILKQIRHTSIVRLYETFESSKHILFVIELCSGGDLLNYVRKRRRLKENIAKFVFKQILDGLNYCHSKNILHRDIKLDNILLNSEGEIKIGDFGVSKVVKNGERMTEQCGTPAYIAPEILKDKGYEGFTVDIWSAGVVLFAMLYGTVPFKANNMHDLHKLILKAKYSLKDDISEEGRNLLKGLLECDVKKRLTMKEIFAHPWMENIEENICLFSEREKKTIKNEFSYKRRNKDSLSSATDSFIQFTETNIDSTQNDLTKNITTKSIILAPFNSTKTNLSTLRHTEEEFYSAKRQIIKFSGKVRDIDRQYEKNNNCELDNGVYNKFICDSLNSNKDNKDDNENEDTKDNKEDKENGEEEKEKKKRNKDKQHSSSSDAGSINNSFEQDEHNPFSTPTGSVLASSRLLDTLLSHNQNSIHSPFKDPHKINLPTPEPVLALDYDVVGKIQEFGFKKNYVVDSLQNNELNYATTTYYLLANK